MSALELGREQLPAGMSHTHTHTHTHTHPCWVSTASLVALTELQIHLLVLSLILGLRSRSERIPGSFHNHVCLICGEPCRVSKVPSSVLPHLWRWKGRTGGCSHLRWDVGKLSEAWLLDGQGVIQYSRSHNTPGQNLRFSLLSWLPSS